VLPTLAVTFDFWNTLVVSPPSLLAGLRHAAVQGALASAGSSADAAALDGALSRAGLVHEDAWTAGRPFVPRDAAEALLAALPPLSADDAAEVRAAYLDACADAELRLVPGAARALRTLEAAGIPLAIVCDVGLTGSTHLRGFLAREGLLDAFAGWAFSDEVGCFKPAGAMFRTALDATGVGDPRCALHVGDLRRTDVAGARAAGMATARFRGIDDDPAPGPEAHAVVDRLEELTPDRVAAIVRQAAAAAPTGPRGAVR
jgi:FMN phosphatase YigB (HAD superfamily)